MVHKGDLIALGYQPRINDHSWSTDLNIQRGDSFCATLFKPWYYIRFCPFLSPFFLLVFVCDNIVLSGFICPDENVRLLNTHLLCTQLQLIIFTCHRLRTRFVLNATMALRCKLIPSTNSLLLKGLTLRMLIFSGYKSMEVQQLTLPSNSHFGLLVTINKYP